MVSMIAEFMVCLYDSLKFVSTETFSTVAGRIEEYDSPARLLENKYSSFAQLVAEYTVRSNSSLEKFD